MTAETAPTSGVVSPANWSGSNPIFPERTLRVSNRIIRLAVGSAFVAGLIATTGAMAAAASANGHGTQPSPGETCVVVDKVSEDAGGHRCRTPSPTPSASPTKTASPSPSASSSPSPTTSPSASPTVTPTTSPSVVPSVPPSVPPAPTVARLPVTGASVSMTAAIGAALVLIGAAALVSLRLSRRRSRA